MLKQQQEILEKHHKLPKQNTKALHTNFVPVHRDGFYTNPGNHPSLPWDPNPPATTKREGIQKIRHL